MGPAIQKAVRLALAQVGKPYVFGAEATSTDPSPEAFDCSELTQWIDLRVGTGKLPDGSMNQRAYCQQQDTMVSIAKGLRTRGALFFRDISVLGVGHVAISLGDGRTVEARGSAYGCGVFDANPKTRLWTEAALWPGFDYSKPEQVEMVERWILFGPFGGRHAHAKELADLIPAVKKFNKAHPHRPALLIRREEPKDLDELKADDYPRWLAEKLRAA